MVLCHVTWYVCGAMSWHLVCLWCYVTTLDMFVVLCHDTGYVCGAMSWHLVCLWCSVTTPGKIVVLCYDTWYVCGALLRHGAMSRHLVCMWCSVTTWCYGTISGKFVAHCVMIVVFCYVAVIHSMLIVMQ